MIEEVVIWSRKREFVADDALLAELRGRGFEPQVVGEIDPPPKNGGSWVLRDKRDRRNHEDGGVWIAWTRPRGSESREGFTVRYVVETFDGRSGWDWFLSCAVAAAISAAAKGMVSVDGAKDRDAEAFTAELAKDPSTIFHGPESVVDWESENLEEGHDEDDDDEYEAEGGDGDDDDEDDEDEDDDEDADEDEEGGDDDEEDDDEEDEDDDEDEDDEGEEDEADAE